MRLSQNSCTIAVAAAVAASALAAAGVTVGHNPVSDRSQGGPRTTGAERPTAQYRGRYQLKLDEARDLPAEAPTGPPSTDDT